MERLLPGTWYTTFVRNKAKLTGKTVEEVLAEEGQYKFLTRFGSVMARLIGDEAGVTTCPLQDSMRPAPPPDFEEIWKRVQDCIINMDEDERRELFIQLLDRLNIESMGKNRFSGYSRKTKLEEITRSLPIYLVDIENVLKKHIFNTISALHTFGYQLPLDEGKLIYLEEQNLFLQTNFDVGLEDDLEQIISAIREAFISREFRVRVWPDTLAKDFSTPDIYDEHVSPYIERVITETKETWGL